MRLAVYTDSVYREVDGVIYGEISFTLFIAALGQEGAEVTVVGRLDPAVGTANYALPEAVRFIGLPFYATLSRPVDAFRSLFGSLRRFWRVLGSVDSVWLFGPYLHALLFAALARLRGRRVILGVRQDFPAYVRGRRPHLRWMHLAADGLELAWRGVARLCPVVVVGSDLAANYRHAKRVLPITVSLITPADIALGEQAAGRSYEGPLKLLSVGRLDEEKNPLLLAEILALLHRADRRWQLIVCGDGPLKAALADRLAQLGLSESAELRGHVPLHAGLMEIYRTSHVFLHVSWTEGLPQVLTEALASGLPVVATDVGGVRGAVNGAGLLIPPGSAAAAADAVARVSSDPSLRKRLVEAGFAQVRLHTLGCEVRRVTEFIRRG